MINFAQLAIEIIDRLLVSFQSALLNFDGTIALATPKSVLLIRFQSSVRLGEVSLG